MAKKVQGNGKNGVAHKSQAKPRCIAHLEREITNSREFIRAIGVLCGDVAAGRIGPTQANAISGAQRNILKTLEMQQKFGSPQKDSQSKLLAIGN